MKEISVIDIEYIEPYQEKDLTFRYKPDVPKLKLSADILDIENEEEQRAILFLTQNQLYKVINNKEIDLKWEEDRWVPHRSITEEQMAKLKMVEISVEHIADLGDVPCFEVMNVKT